MRPRRFGHLQSWVELHADRVRRSGDPVRLTLGAADVLSARGVRLGLVAPALDSLGLQVEPQWLPPDQLGGQDDTAIFTAQLAMRLAGEIALEVETSVARRGEADEGEAGHPGAAGGDDDLPEDPAAARSATETLARLIEVGARGVHMASWSDWGTRARDAPPSDARPALARRGLVDSSGAPTAVGDAWFVRVAAEPGVQPAQPWPGQLDIEDYYAHLPDSARELHVQWQRGRDSVED